MGFEDFFHCREALFEFGIRVSHKDLRVDVPEAG